VGGWLGGVLFYAAVIAAALYFPALRRRVNKAKELTEKTASRPAARVAAVAPVSTGDPTGEGEHVLGIAGQEGELGSCDGGLPLSRDPVLRTKQVLNTLCWPDRWIRNRARCRRMPRSGVLHFARRHRRGGFFR